MNIPDYVIFYSTNAVTGEVTETKHYLTDEEKAYYEAEEKAKYQSNNKQMAKDLLNQTDWATIADVSDPTKSNPYLANSNDFITYRNALRAIVFNPPDTEIEFPIMPTEDWQTI